MHNYYDIKSKPVRIVASIGIIPAVVSALKKDAVRASKKFVEDVKDEMAFRKEMVAEYEEQFVK